MHEQPIRTSEPPGALRAGDLRCSRASTDEAVHLVVAGELDVATAPKLDVQVRGAAGEGAVVLDLRSLEFIDLVGAHLLVELDERVRRWGGRFVVVRGPAQVQRVFELSGIDQVLEVVDLLPDPPARELAQA